MIQRFAFFVREKYSYIIISSLVAGIVVGFYTSYPGMLLRQFSVLFVVVMIASMGFTITFRSFALALKDFKGFSVGMVLNFVFAPIICFALAFAVPQREIAVGLILIGAVLCAGMAIVWAGLLDGNVPLAVVINTGTMLLAPFFIPIIMLWLAGSYVKINALAMLLNLIYTILLPVIAGMLLRELAERKTDVKKYLPPFAYFLSSKLFDRAKNIAITYSCGMKNLPIALAIAIMSFGSLTALPIAVAFAFQMLTAVAFYRIYRAKGGGLSV